MFLPLFFLRLFYSSFYFGWGSVHRYPFAIPDDPSNIRFESTGCTTSDDGAHRVAAGAALIRGGTLEKLVERLTHPSQVDVLYVIVYSWT